MNIDFLFQHIDIDNSGTITIDELKAFMKDNDVSFLEIDAKTIMADLDQNQDGVITNEEFKVC